MKLGEQFCSSVYAVREVFRCWVAGWWAVEFWMWNEGYVYASVNSLLAGDLFVLFVERKYVMLYSRTGYASRLKTGSNCEL